MGNAMNSCCTPTENPSFTRQIITTDSNQAYNQHLKDFMAKYPRLKDTYERKWSYCPNINKSYINVTPSAIFVGKIEKDKLSEAVVLYNDGYIYEGELMNEVREGLGRLISYDGDCYEGKWINNDAEGQGTYQGANPKRKYTGYWHTGFLQGKGKATFEDGSQYEGQFYMNTRHGKGKVKYADGSYYEGDFKNNIIEGFGTLIGINHKYEGSWRNGKMDGAGKSSWFNQDEQLLETYEGQYENGLKQGKGEYRWCNGRVFTGEWEMGEIKKTKNDKKSK